MRRHWITSSDIAWLAGASPPPGGPRAHQQRRGGTGARRRHRADHQYAPYLAPLPADAARFAPAARAHWSIENGLHRVLHRVLDVVFREDDCRVRRRNGPANFATLRRLAQNLLQRAPAGASLRVQRKRAGWDHGFLQQVLTAP